MKNKFINKTILYAACLLLGFSATSCSDLTDTESVVIHEPTILEKNPELYAQYLENLRNYKTSEHKYVYAWFNNKEKTPFSRAHHLSVLPDSIDIVSLMHPDTLTQVELEQMEQLRKDKGTKFIFSMDFEAIKLIYDTRAADMANADEGEAPAAKMPEFVQFLVDTVNQTLPLVKKYNFDGISVAYKGKSILHMTEIEKAQHRNYETAFIGIAKDWHERNNDKMIVFEGYPQNLLDKSILPSCKHIIIPCMAAKAASKLTYELLSASVEGVPTDKFIVAVDAASVDTEDTKTGFWADGKRAIAGAAQWVAASHSGTSVSGLGIRNVNNDYYNKAFIYPYTRNAISTINPSIKK